VISQVPGATAGAVATVFVVGSTAIVTGRSVTAWRRSPGAGLVKQSSRSKDDTSCSMLMRVSNRLDTGIGTGSPTTTSVRVCGLELVAPGRMSFSRVSAPPSREQLNTSVSVPSGMIVAVCRLNRSIPGCNRRVPPGVPSVSQSPVPFTLSFAEKNTIRVMGIRFFQIVSGRDCTGCRMGAA
jgi:hypothetical protein